MRALEIDPMLPQAHASLGIIKLRYDWDWQGAEGEFKQGNLSGSGSQLFHSPPMVQLLLPVAATI
jgi:hypothetical protein